MATVALAPWDRELSDSITFEVARELRTPPHEPTGRAKETRQFRSGLVQAGR